MPSTYSTNLKLELMATGENSGTWGTKTNNNLGTLLEQSIVGQATIAMADADQTVAILDGVTSDGRCMVLMLTGVLSANRVLTVPTINKNYIVDNSTTGGFYVQVKTAAGTGVIVRNGARSALYVDGTNVIAGISAVGKVQITQPSNNATLTIANSKTFTANNSITLSGTDGTTFTFPTTDGSVATLDGTQTFTNKTLTDCTANTQAAGNNSTKIATTAYVDASAGIGTPTGVIFPYGGSSTPSGWLLCDGSAVSRTTYATLFGVIGTTFGTGDGSTTFNVPDMRGRLAAGRDNMGGSSAGRLTGTSMSPDSHTVGATGGSQTQTASTTVTGTTSGSLSTSGTTSAIPLSGSANTGGGSAFNIVNAGTTLSVTGTTSGSLSVSASGTSSSFVNVQPTMLFNFIIKT